jgi:hypothetical protein
MSYTGSTSRAPRPTPRRTVTELPVSSSPQLGFFQAAFDRAAVSYFLSNIWSTLIFVWTLYFIAAASTSDGNLPFSAVTNVTLFLVFVTRSGLVPCPNLAAATGTFGLFTLVTFWIVVAARGRVAAFGDTSNMLFTDLTSHLAIPLDALVRPILAGSYATFLGAWYVLALVLLYVSYVLTLSTPPYPFLEEWDAASLYGFYAGASVGIVVLHVLVVLTTRRLRR